MAQLDITVSVECNSPAEKKNIEASLKKLASLGFEERKLITELIDNPKALKALAEHKDMLMTMI